jgi:hypothetical protein
MDGIIFNDPNNKLSRGAVINIAKIFEVCRELGVTDGYIIRGLYVAMEPEGSLEHKAEKACGRESELRFSNYANMDGSEYDYRSRFQHCWGGEYEYGGKMVQGYVYKNAPAMTINNVDYPNMHTPEARKAYFEHVWLPLMKEIWDEDSGKSGPERYIRTEAAWMNTIYGIRRQSDLRDRGEGNTMKWEDWSLKERITDPGRAGHKFRGIGLMQTTGPSGFRKMGEFLVEAGLITQNFVKENPEFFIYDSANPNTKSNTFPYPDDHFTNSSNTYKSDGKLGGGNLFDYITDPDGRLGVLVRGLLYKKINDIMQDSRMRAEVRNGVIRHELDKDGPDGPTRPDLTQQALNQLNCIDQEWLGLCLGIFICTGAGSKSSQKKSKVHDKQEEVFEKHGMSIIVTQKLLLVYRGLYFFSDLT